jgi:hypothetical protein
MLSARRHLPNGSHPARAVGIALAAALLCLALLGGSASAAGAAVSGHKVTLTVREKPSGSGRVLASGAVTPAPASARVEVEWRSDGRWARLGDGPLKQGKFSISTSSHGMDRLAVRALVLQGKRQIGTSAVRTVNIKQATAPGDRKEGGGSPSGGGGGGGGGNGSGSGTGGSGSGDGSGTGSGGGLGALPPGPGETTPPPGGDETTPPAEDPLSAASLMATIDGYSSLPDHLSATANSTAAEGEFEANLAAAGLTLGEQAFEFPRFAVSAVGLTAGGAAVPGAAIAPLLYSGTTPAGGVTAPLVYGGEGEGTFTEAQAKGKIVVVATRYEHNSKAVGLDPAIEKAVKAGAKGLVAVTEAVGDYPKWEDVNARRGTGPLPVLMVGKRSGAAVLAAAERGEAGKLTLAADTSGTSCERDVWGELEGAEPGRRVFVGTPLSSFTPSASEHGSGLAITLGLARHYAALPQSERPETLVFMALGGHEIGWLGLQALLASSRGQWFREADAYVHLGSALGAPTAVEESDGTIVTTPTPDPTGRLHDSENPLLERPIIEDFEAAGVPTPETPPHIASGGEQTNAYAAGVPTVSFSGASLFFHTAGDTPSAVDPMILAADADAFRRAVDTITAIPAGRLKAENAHAAQLGSEIDAAARAPVNPTLGAGGSVLGSGGVGGPAAVPVASCP